MNRTVNAAGQGIPTPKELRERISREEKYIAHLNRVIILRERKIRLLKELIHVSELLLIELTLSTDKDAEQMIADVKREHAAAWRAMTERRAAGEKE